MNPNRTDRHRNGRRKCRMACAIFLLLCCLLSFSCGKIVGQAQKRTQESRKYAAQALRELLQEEESGGRRKKRDAGREDPDGQVAVAGQENILILVNKEHPLPGGYEVELVTFQDGIKQGAKAAYDPLCQMLRAGIRDGMTFKICSAYRSVERQSELFDEDVNALMARGYSYERAYEQVAKETMPPGYSEHATGLAFDIVSCDYQVLDARQELTAENQWLREHCAEYGFILRYPKDKEEITGISYESWHFRYVGVEAAGEITRRGITLEEYLEEYSEE